MVSEAGFGWTQGFELRVDPSFWKDHNVQVIICLRPLNSSEISLQGQNRCVRQDSCQALTWTGHPESRFTFDLVADEHVSQERLFKEVGVPMVENCMTGYNSCMFAYGQTGSGKTHTMLGDIEGVFQRNNVNCGMTPRVFKYLFSRIHMEKEAHSRQKLDFTCRCSFFEIYNEQILDLLDPSSTNLQVREDAKKGVHVENLKEYEVSSPMDVIQQLIQGTANRKVASTNMNHASSRSHSVFTCIIEKKWESQGVTHHRFARLNLVDLAGSERQKSSGAEGDRLKEATNINKSLSTLGFVIMNLVSSSSKRQPHVPYRDSKLTFILQDSLGGNSKTMIIANVSPSNCCASETLSTLKFAQRAKFIRNKAIVNEENSGDALTLRLQIQQERKRNEATLVTALRRIHDKEEEFKALAAERDAADQLIIYRTEEVRSLKLKLRFREDAIRRLEELPFAKLSPESHILHEREELRKELDALQKQVDRNSEMTKYVRENMQLREELKRLKSFVEDGEREMMNEQITVLQDKLLDALDWKLMHEKNSEDHSLFSWDSSVNKENEVLYLEAIQNQREIEALRKNLTVCLEAKENLERQVGELLSQIDDERKMADNLRQESQLPQTLEVISDDQMKNKTMVDAIAAAIQSEAEANETAITLARENEELHLKPKVLIEDNKLIDPCDSTAFKSAANETSDDQDEDLVKFCGNLEDKKVKNLEHQLGEMHEENEKLRGLYEKAMQERDDFKRMFASEEIMSAVQLDLIEEVKSSCLIEKAANEVKTIYNRFQEVDCTVVLKKQEIKALRLSLSDLGERKTVFDNKILSLKTALHSFSSKFGYGQKRDVCAKGKYESCLASWKQKNEKLEHFRSLKNEIDTSLLNAKQSEAELKNNYYNLKMQLQAIEGQRKENERVLFSIDILSISEPRNLNFGKATELIKSEEERTKICMEMKKLKQKMAPFQKKLAKLSSKSESLGSKIEKVEAEIECESSQLQELKLACQRIAGKNQMIFALIEVGIADYGRIFIDYQECIFQADLKKCEIDQCEDELKLETEQMEELRSVQKAAVENLLNLIEANRCRRRDLTKQTL